MEREREKEQGDAGKVVEQLPGVLRERESERVRVCVRERERVRVCVSVREQECVCVREREGELERVGPGRCASRGLAF